MKQTKPAVPCKVLHALSRFLCCLLLILFAGNNVRAQVSLTATGGVTGPTVYTTLKGAFDAVNAGTHTGVITINITASTTETATAVLNASGNASASYTSVLVKPATGVTPTITGAITAGAIIKLNGASNVTINGSNNGTSSRDLTISNTSVTTPNVIFLGSVGATPISGDSLKNCTIINGVNTSTAIGISDATTLGVAGYFNNITIRNNSIQRAYIGMYLITVATAGNGNNTLVADNDLNTSGTNAIRLCAIYLQGLSGATVSNNNVGNFETTSAEYDRGIFLATGVSNAVVSGNTVTNLNYSGASGYAPYGIQVSPGIANANITISNNVVSNLTTASTGITNGIYLFTAVSGVTIQKNKVSNIKNTNAGGFGCAGIYVASSLSAANTTVANNFIWDVAAYGYNGYGTGDNGNGLVLDGGGGYNIYYNTIALNTEQVQTGSTHAAAMLITANLFTAASVNLQDNIFVNLQTVGGAGSKLAIVCNASNTIFASNNYNDYFASSGNLGYYGPSATTMTTLAQIQASLGGNANSLNILPVFTSATDLHLPTASNTALNNLGTPITGITSDIDNDPRTATPDMGADEFGNCQTVTMTAQPISATICENSSTSFSSAATNGTVYQWQVNTGSGFTNITNGGVYSGATSGILSIINAPATMNGYTYQVLISSGAGCTQVSSSVVTLTVNPLPNTTITPSGSTNFCTGGSVTLSVPQVTGLNYQWKNGAANIGGATGSAYTATATGSYSVVVTNPLTGCTSTSSTVSVTVGSGPSAVITPSGNAGFCIGGSLVLSAGSSAGVTYQWQLNGSPITGATSNSYTANAAGSYTVVVSTGPTCNTVSAPTIVTVNPLPIATATANGNTSVCLGNAVTISANLGTSLSYIWNLNGVPVVPANTGAAYVANTGGNYSVTVTNTVTGCQNTSSPVTITMVPLPTPSISPTGTATICNGDSMLLTTPAVTGFTYQWKLNGVAISGAGNNTFNATSPGSYMVTVTNASNCSGTSPGLFLVVNPSPVSEITYNSPLSFCEGGGVGLNATPNPGASIQWLLNSLPISGASGNVYLVTRSGVYTLMVTNNFGCARISPPVVVVVYPLPIPVITQNNSVLSTGSYATYQWFRNNGSIGGANSANLNLVQNGAYKVQVTDNNGCTGTSAIMFVNTLGVGGAAATQDVRIYPNPANDFIRISNKSRLDLKRIMLLNSTGAIVRNLPLSDQEQTLSIGDLPAGIYTIRILTDQETIIRKLEILK